MDPKTIIHLADGAEYGLPHEIEDLQEILDHSRRYGDMPGLELACGCGCVWVNPDLVTAVRPVH